VRAVRGGVGFAKTGGNYAASILAGSKAKHAGYAQVLWLDARENRYVEEVGTSNIFFMIGDRLITPPLGGTILPGVTRDSVLKLAAHLGVKVEESRITITEVISAIEEGTLKDAFATGTAAVISPVGQIYYHNREYLINEGKTGELAEKLYHEILQIQYGLKEDPFGWRMQIA